MRLEYQDLKLAENRGEVLCLRRNKKHKFATLAKMVYAPD